MKVLVATKNLTVFEVLRGMEKEGVTFEPALTTGQVYAALPKSHLVVLNLNDLVEHPYTRETLQDVVKQSGIPSTSAEEFLKDPSAWLKQAQEGERAGRGTTTLPQQRTVAFVSYSGGTGKTILALDTAVHFARRTRLPVLLAEFTYGESALAAITGLNMPHLFDLATQLDVKATLWKGVTLVPMDYEHCQDLPVGQLARYFKDQMGKHVLMVVDSQWRHGLIGAVEGKIDQWFVVATPRADAVANARKLRNELGSKASIIVNQKSTADSLALTGLERALDLPRIQEPDRFEGQLGREILALTYGKENWRRYEPQGFVANLGRRLGFGRRGDSSV